MNTRLPRLLVCAFPFLFLLGCATNRIDWNSRVGLYTYDDAVLEMGVPDRQATLSDGSIVAEWLTRRGGIYGHSHYFRGARFNSFDISQFPDRYLRLAFAPDGKLLRADNFAR